MNQTPAQSAAETIERIRGGEPPWVAMGDFLDDWRRATPTRRRAMIRTPVQPEGAQKLARWASLLAASVDRLCWIAEPRMPAPAWVLDPRFILPEPWFLLPGWRSRAHQLVDTPAAFKARNIFGGDRILARV